MQAVPNQGPRPGARLPEPANPKLPTFFIIETPLSGTVKPMVQMDSGVGVNPSWHISIPRKSMSVKSRPGGLSSRTYLTFGYWDRVLAMLKPATL
jgi:hypothetical protein